MSSRDVTKQSNVAVPDKRRNWLKHCLVGDGVVGDVIEPAYAKFLSIERLQMPDVRS